MVARNVRRTGNVRQTGNVRIEEQNQDKGRNHGSNSHNDPMKLVNSDHLGMQLTSTLLTGRNYLSWSRSVSIALRAKGKLGFVDGTLAKPANDSSQLEQWIQSDCKVRSLLLNSISKELVDAFIYTTSAKDLWDELKKRYGKSNGPLLYQIQREVNTMSQGTMSVEQYFTKMKRLWDELICLMPLPTCTCEAAKEVSEFTETMKLMQFLTGLNDAYDNIKSQILVAEPLPSVHRACTLVMRIEKQHDVNDSFNTIRGSSATMARSQGVRSYEAGRGGNIGDNWSGRNNHDGWSNRNNQKNWNGRNNPGEGTSKMNNSHDKRSKYCNYCRKTGHLEDKCFEKHGYPNWYKSLKDGKAKQSGGGKSTANISKSPFDADIGNGEDKYNNNTKRITNIQAVEDSSRRKEELNWEDFTPTVEDSSRRKKELSGEDFAPAVEDSSRRKEELNREDFTPAVEDSSRRNDELNREDFEAPIVEDSSRRKEELNRNDFVPAVEDSSRRKEELNGEDFAPTMEDTSRTRGELNWEAFAPTVEDYNSVLAKAIAGGTGQIVKVIFKCSNAYTNQVQKVVENTSGRKNNANGPKKMGVVNKSLKSVRRLSQTVETTSKAILVVVGGARGSVTARAVRSQAGKKILHMLPTEVVSASVDAVEKIIDAAEAAEKQAMTASSSAVTMMVSNRYGESVGEATEDVLATAGHVASTAWNVFKIRKAINPASSMSSGALKNTAKDRKP